MSILRRVASRLLSFAVRHSGAGAASWGDAMLREMDFVESDWSALLWAFGCTTTLCRHWRVRGAKPALAGVVVAAAIVGASVLALVGLIQVSWFDSSQEKIAIPFFVVVVPEAAFLLGIAALWRRRRQMAFGMLAAGALLITHALLHHAT